jgi:hypothetical protein
MLQKKLDDNFHSEITTWATFAAVAVREAKQQCTLFSFALPSQMEMKALAHIQRVGVRHNELRSESAEKRQRRFAHGINEGNVC